jgi:hypothetical protein
MYGAVRATGCSLMTGWYCSKILAEIAERCFDCEK